MSDTKLHRAGEEYPGLDQLQVAMLLVFLAVWASDSFLLKYTVYANLAHLMVRLPGAGALIGLGLVLIDRSHKLALAFIKRTSS